ncbi:conserved hypothetical protein [Nitrosopumilaceae archaeon]|nr:conserved hypothetical protein [Nitrosopumilaceae archaeon]
MQAAAIRAMNKQAMDLGFLLKQIPGYDFSMAEFDDRLRLQKMVYLLQAFGVYLGYDFNWYLRGPYCTVLTANAFVVAKFYGEIPDRRVTFKSSLAQERFEKFLEFNRGKSVDDLEIAASLHYQSRVLHKDDGESKKAVVAKRPSFTPEMVGRVWAQMEGCGLV